MDLDQLDLNPRIIAAAKKAKLKSTQEVLHFSGPDLQRLTGLSGPDVQHLLRTVCSHLRGGSLCTALDLHRQKGRFPEQHQRLSLGCPVLDGLLRGGLPLGGITELAGRSSVGKTQLALQLCLAVQLPRRLGGLEAGAVYVCTEDAFPDRRLQQLIAQQQQRLRTDAPGDMVEKINFGDHIFIEHVADVDALLECVQRKVPLLLSRGMARLVVIDSVAAPFRCEFDGPASVRRARALQALGAALRRLSCTYRSPVLCVNQVTEAMEEQDTAPRAPGERLAPALGITWSNQLLMRLVADRQRPEEAPRGRPGRTLRVVFAPHLPPSSCSYTVSAEGVRGTLGPSPADQESRLLGLPGHRLQVSPPEVSSGPWGSAFLVQEHDPLPGHEEQRPPPQAAPFPSGGLGRVFYFSVVSATSPCWVGPSARKTRSGHRRLP